MFQQFIQSGAFFIILPIIALFGLAFCEWEEHKFRIAYQSFKDSVDDTFRNLKAIKPSTDNVKAQVAAMLDEIDFDYKRIIVNTESESTYYVKVY